MTRMRAIRWALGVVAFCAICSASSAIAQVGVGTWERQGLLTPGQPLTMTVEACCGSGRRLIYRVPGAEAPMTVESPFNGSEVPVLLGGKPSGQTMAITQTDPRHWTTVMKVKGQVFGTSKATLSADGRTLSVENDMSGAVGANNPAAKSTETWVKK